MAPRKKPPVLTPEIEALLDDDARARLESALARGGLTLADFRPGGRDTALHDAAEAGRADEVKRLLAAGAEVNGKDHEGRTALEVGLADCSSAKVQDMAEVVRLLLAAGARVSPSARRAMAEIGERFEQHRDGFSRRHLAATSAAMLEMGELLGVKPPARWITLCSVSPGWSW